MWEEEGEGGEGRGGREEIGEGAERGVGEEGDEQTEKRKTRGEMLTSPLVLSFPPSFLQHTAASIAGQVAATPASDSSSDPSVRTHLSQYSGIAPDARLALFVF